MRFVVRFENPDKVPDGAGGRTEDFSDYMNTRGSVLKQRGSDNFVEGTFELVSAWTIFVYWRRIFDSYITKDTRVIYDNRIFRMMGKERVGETNHIMKLTLISVE